MRPSTQVILNGPFLDTAWAKGILETLKRSYPLAGEEVILAVMKTVLLSREDRLTDYDFLHYIGLEMTSPMSKENQYLKLGQAENRASERYRIPLFSTMSAYWKARDYTIPLALR